jgi:hypothetical protein
MTLKWDLHNRRIQKAEPEKAAQGMQWPAQLLQQVSRDADYARWCESFLGACSS